jgi:hypothetical protein
VRERERGKFDQIDALAVARAVVTDGADSFPVAHLDEGADPPFRLRVAGDALRAPVAPDKYTRSPPVTARRSRTVRSARRLQIPA